MTSPDAADHNEVRFLMVHPALWPDLVDWLARRGQQVGKMPQELQLDGHPTFMHTPNDAWLGLAPPDATPPPA